MSHYQSVVEHHKEISILSGIESTLYWDQTTVMPSKAIDFRGEQMAYLSKLMHEKQTSSKYGSLLEKALLEVEKDGTEDEKANISILLRKYKRNIALDSNFVEKMSLARIAGYQNWEKAKKENNFSIFQPHFEKLVELSKEAADRYGCEGSPYNGLTPDFERGISTDVLDKIFEPLQSELSEIYAQIREKQKEPELKIVGQDFCLDAQKSINKKLLDELGFSLDNGFSAESAHPFSTTLGKEDFRITSRYIKDDLMSAFMATAHEVGHSLYERGLNKEQYGLPCGTAGSAGVHESQSLFWENRVARSESFLTSWFEEFQRYFPKQLEGANAEQFINSVNHVNPGLIRVDSDEVGYCLHITIRYNIEKALIEGKLKVSEVPEVWNQEYERLLNIRPHSDQVGCLQDIHWSEALFGYFPSYALGHLISAQYTEKMEKDLGSIESIISDKNYKSLRDWLLRNIHCHGAKYDAPDLIKLISGEELSGDAFIRYLKKKYLS